MSYLGIPVPDLGKTDEYPWALPVPQRDAQGYFVLDPNLTAAIHRLAAAIEVYNAKKTSI